MSHEDQSRPAGAAPDAFGGAAPSIPPVGIPATDEDKYWRLFGRPKETPAPQLTTPAEAPAGGTAYGRAALADEARQVAATPEGQRNDRLNAAAYSIGRLIAGGQVDPTEAHDTLTAAGLAAGLTPRETAATVRSGLRGGGLSPRVPPEREDYRASAAPVTATATAGGDPPATPAPTVVTMATVAPERVSWLWPGYLPSGKLVIIDGDPSMGKSTLTLDMAARVSAGRPWPDGSPSTAGGVLLLSAEDGLADTIAPRLAAAGADMARVHALVEVPTRGADGQVRMAPPSLPRDIPHLAAVIARHHVRLVIVDVLMAYLSGVDSHRDQDVRGVLHQLAAMADVHGCTIVLVRHLNKAGGSHAMYRGGGSIGIIGAARAAYLVGRDPDDDGRRVLAPTKANLGGSPPALAYRLVDVPDHGCARVVWDDGPVDIAAAALLATPTPEDRSESAEARDWLVDLLTSGGGVMARRDVDRAARAEGIPPKVLRRAREKAGVTVERVGYPAATYWRLPDLGNLPSAPAKGPSLGSGNLAPVPVAPSRAQSCPVVMVGTTDESWARLAGDGDSDTRPETAGNLASASKSAEAEHPGNLASGPGCRLHGWADNCPGCYRCDDVHGRLAPQG